jgi:hypothetical protein
MSSYCMNNGWANAPNLVDMIESVRPITKEWIMIPSCKTFSEGLVEINLDG